MPSYRCKIADKDGKIAQVVRRAFSEEELLRDYAGRGLFPLSVERIGEGKKAGGGGKFSSKVVLDFTESLALLLLSGLSIKDALEVMTVIFQTGDTGRLVEALLAAIHRGSSFSDAVAGLDGSFPPIYQALVRIGERIGNLEQICGKLAAYLKDEKSLREKILNSLLYPAMVLGTAFFGLLMIAFVLLPKMNELFSALGEGMGEKVTSVSSMIRAFSLGGAIGGAVVAGLIVLIVFSRRNEESAVFLDRLFLKLPFAGTFLLHKEMMHFFFAVETLTDNGVPVEDALEESRPVMSNKALRAEIRTVREKVLKGLHLSEALLDSPGFPDRVGRWTTIGERAGQIEKVFGQLRRYYQGEVERWTTRFMNLVEPVLIILVGGLLLVFVLVFIVPLFSLYGAIL
jgi:type II secretory pathway component PulF